ncbi:unnamed protein product [Notodromas monacha]|uniref:PAS domain-containing protein n=1 Tax=Notodromas monacha TaxID=399045 RepID=A0A7R9BVT8_9CRUS|nr:unnamed protein product [Notodromas monacha]CAG0921695.1 unnamed protein product [Notodromas monacha]
MIYCLRPQYTFPARKSPPPLLGMAGIAIGLPPPSVHEVRLENESFVARLGFDFRIAHCEAKVAELLDYAPDELTGKCLYTLCHAEDVNVLRKCHLDLIAKGQILTPYYRILNKNGGFTWVQTCATVICNAKSSEEQNIICINNVISACEFENFIMDMCQLHTCPETRQTSNAGDSYSLLVPKRESSTPAMDNAAHESATDASDETEADLSKSSLSPSRDSLISQHSDHGAISPSSGLSRLHRQSADDERGKPDCTRRGKKRGLMNPSSSLANGLGHSPNSNCKRKLGEPGVDSDPMQSTDSIVESPHTQDQSSDVIMAASTESPSGGTILPADEDSTRPNSTDDDGGAAAKAMQWTASKLLPLDGRRSSSTHPHEDDRMLHQHLPHDQFVSSISYFPCSPTQHDFSNRHLEASMGGGDLHQQHGFRGQGKLVPADGYPAESPVQTGIVYSDYTTANTSPSSVSPTGTNPGSGRTNKLYRGTSLLDAHEPLSRQHHQYLAAAVAAAATADHAVGFLPGAKHHAFGPADDLDPLQGSPPAASRSQHLAPAPGHHYTANLTSPAGFQVYHKSASDEFHGVLPSLKNAGGNCWFPPTS